MGSLRSLRHNLLSKKNQPKKPKCSWRGLLARRLREKIQKEYPMIRLVVKPNYRKTSTVYINWSFPVTPPAEDQDVINSIKGVTSAFINGKSCLKPLGVTYRLWENTLVIQEVR
jgi:hypothetical protein